MSWSYLPELEEVFSGKTFSAMLLLEPLRLSRIAAASCCSGSVISAARCSRSGTTSPRSGSTTRNAAPISNGCAQSATNSPSAADFLVRISARAARVAESPGENRGSGSRWRALSAKYDRRRCSWKIAPCSPLVDSKKSSLRWPRWGMMRAGVCWALDTSDTPLSETGYGYWGSISRTMAGWMTPGSSKRSLKLAAYGAQKQSLVCQMLIRHDLWPTVSLLERLMGWPMLWTALEPLAMDKYLQWLHSPGGF